MSGGHSPDHLSCKPTTAWPDQKRYELTDVLIGDSLTADDRRFALGRSYSDGVDGDAAIPQFLCEDLRKALHRCFGCHIRSRAGDCRTDNCGRLENDRTAWAERTSRFASDEESTTHDGAEHRVEMIDSELSHEFPPKEPGAVDDDIHPREFFPHPRERVHHLLLVGDIDRQGDALRPQGSHQFKRCARRIRAAEAVEQHDRIALSGKRECDRTAHAM